VTLAFALAAAGVGALAAAFFRQSLVLGYILAGLAIGPNTPGSSSMFRRSNNSRISASSC